MEKFLSTNLLMRSSHPFLHRYISFLLGEPTHLYCQASIFTLGCYYRNSGTAFMSMYGSVTDAQVFSRELSDQEMVDMTTCK